jgi:tRNA(Ile)-lysidine synthase
VNFTKEDLLRRVAELEEVAGKPVRFVVAFSGGLDSSVLTHALADSCGEHGIPITAIHVDHGLQSESAAWAEHCEKFASALGIEFATCEVTVDLHSGLGPEAAARQARYSALRNYLEPGDWLVSAHHMDDQAETVLMNLMRGSGTSGLAGISAARRIACGWLVRPLLDVPGSALQDYANSHSLDYITDPSNLDQKYDRNYLRHEILPRLNARWPDAASRIRRSARLAREATALLCELAEIDRRAFADRSDRLSIAELGKLPKERQRNLLRYLILELGLPSPGAVHLEQIVEELVQAREDAQPLVAWSGARARRYRDRLYLLPGDDLERPVAQTQKIAGEKILLPGGQGVLELEKSAGSGLSDAILEQGLELRYRVGGEEFKPVGQAYTRKLKKLLQEEGVVPWMREQLPLLYSRGQPVAVADLWIAADAAAEPGTSVKWKNRPAIH